MSKELCSNLHCRIYQCLLWVSESLYCHRYAKPDKFYIFSEERAGQISREIIMSWKTFWWSDLYLSTFFKQRWDFLIDRSTFASSFDSSTLLLHQSWKDSTWIKLKLIQTSNTQILQTRVINLPATFPRPSSGAGVDPDGQESKLDLKECVS